MSACFISSSESCALTLSIEVILKFTVAQSDALQVSLVWLTVTPMTDHLVDLLPVIVEREQATLPDGFDTWGLKSVRPDLRTYGGYQWPYPGNVAEADDVEEANTGACPRRPGDGLCVATSWRGMASGGIPARTLLLVATASTDVLGRDDASGKSRHRRVAVVALVDGERLLRGAGWADLRGAYLAGRTCAGRTWAGVPGGRTWAGRPGRGGPGRGGPARGGPGRGGPGDGAYLRGAYLRGAYLAGRTCAGRTWAGRTWRADDADLKARGARL